jgi:hypothetical protein
MGPKNGPAQPEDVSDARRCSSSRSQAVFDLPGLSYRKGFLMALPVDVEAAKEAMENAQAELVAYGEAGQLDYRKLDPARQKVLAENLRRATNEFVDRITALGRG